VCNGILLTTQIIMTAAHCKSPGFTLQDDFTVAELHYDTPEGNAQVLRIPISGHLDAFWSFNPADQDDVMLLFTGPNKSANVDLPAEPSPILVGTRAGRPSFMRGSGQVGMAAFEGFTGSTERDAVLWDDIELATSL
jgi:hypothetical protein